MLQALWEISVDAIVVGGISVTFYGVIALGAGYILWKRNPQLYLFEPRNLRTLIRGWKQ